MERGVSFEAYILKFTHLDKREKIFVGKKKFVYLWGMIRVVIPQEALNRRLPFYLAMEEWVAINFPENDYVFFWTVDPTVICGRNQDIPLEVNLEFCRTHGIDVCRRKSGGGCVYSDRDNLMISFITHAGAIESTFKECTRRIASSLRQLGLQAEATGRNDIVVDGRKISGNAFYRLANRSIVHGTMLFSAKIDNLLGAITPSRAKLESKKVKSVESRVAFIQDMLPGLTFDAFKSQLEHSIADSELELPKWAIPEIEEMEKPYWTENWLKFAKKPRKKHLSYIPGVGNIGIAATVRDKRIEALEISGDFFSAGDIDTLSKSLEGVGADSNSLAEALANLGDECHIAGMRNEALATLIAESAAITS